jgi:uncharacterized protein (DUF3820 family)
LLREHYEEDKHTGETLMTLGMHKGKRYDEIPKTYAQWVAKEDNPSKPLRNYLTWSNENNKDDKVKSPRAKETTTSQKSAPSAGPSHQSYVPAGAPRSKRSAASWIPGAASGKQ